MRAILIYKNIQLVKELNYVKGKPRANCPHIEVTVPPNMPAFSNRSLLCQRPNQASACNFRPVATAVLKAGAHAHILFVYNLSTYYKGRKRFSTPL